MKDHVRVYGRRRWNNFRLPIHIDVEGDAMAVMDVVGALAKDNPDARVVMYHYGAVYRYGYSPEYDRAVELDSRSLNPRLLGGGVDRTTE